MIFFYHTLSDYHPSIESIAFQTERSTIIAKVRDGHNDHDDPFRSFSKLEVTMVEKWVSHGFTKGKIIIDVWTCLVDNQLLLYWNIQP